MNNSIINLYNVNFIKIVIKVDREKLKKFPGDLLDFDVFTGYKIKIKCLYEIFTLRFPSPKSTRRDFNYFHRSGS